MSTPFPQARKIPWERGWEKHGKNFGVNSLGKLAILYKVNIKFCRNTCADKTGEDTYMVLLIARHAFTVQKWLSST